MRQRAVVVEAKAARRRVLPPRLGPILVIDPPPKCREGRHVDGADSVDRAGVGIEIAMRAGPDDPKPRLTAKSCQKSMLCRTSTASFDKDRAVPGSAV